MSIGDIDIKNLQFISEDTGYFFSKTFTEYNWKFVLDGIQRSITLNHSKILGRRTIFLGNQEICRYQRYTYNFQFSFPIDVHNISIIQNDDSYTLKIDGIPFNRLLNEQKLRRFNIIKETFLEKEQMKKDKRKKDREIRKFRTFNKNGGIPISLRSNDRRNIYKTNIYSSNRQIEENLNIENENEINTSSKKNNNNDIINNNIDNDNDNDNEEKETQNEEEHKVIVLNPEQYMIMKILMIKLYKKVSDLQKTIYLKSKAISMKKMMMSQKKLKKRKKIILKMMIIISMIIIMIKIKNLMKNIKLNKTMKKMKKTKKIRI